MDGEFYVEGDIEKTEFCFERIILLRKMLLFFYLSNVTMVKDLIVKN